jgi:mono/diheme cytochrome c family protein
MYKIAAIILILLAALGTIYFLLQQTAKQKKIGEGKELFTKMCSSCHHPTISKTGPAFQKVREIRGNNWVYNFIRNTSKYLSTDKEAKKLRFIFGSNMTSFQLTNGQIDAICEYVDSFPYDPNSKEYNHRK